jgi:hypothetical protein
VNLDNRSWTEAHPLTLGMVPLVNNLGNAGHHEFSSSVWCGRNGLWYAYKPRVSGLVHVIACKGTATVNVYQVSQLLPEESESPFWFVCTRSEFDNGYTI